MRKLILVVALVFGACASQSQEVNSPKLSEAPVQQCRFSAEDIRKSQDAVKPYHGVKFENKDHEALAVLASGMVDERWYAVVTRYSGSPPGFTTIPVAMSGTSDAGVALLVSPGDVILGDLIWKDEWIQNVRLIHKAGFSVSAGCARTMKEG